MSIVVVEASTLGEGWLAVSHAILEQWSYDAARSAEIHAKDRSAIYGGFHLYVKAG